MLEGLWGTTLPTHGIRLARAAQSASQPACHAAAVNNMLASGQLAGQLMLSLFLRCPCCSGSLPSKHHISSCAEPPAGLFLASLRSNLGLGICEAPASSSLLPRLWNLRTAVASRVYLLLSKTGGGGWCTSFIMVIAGSRRTTAEPAGRQHQVFSTASSFSGPVLHLVMGERAVGGHVPLSPGTAS